MNLCDVLLVNPRSFTTIPSYLPYGLLYIAGFLREKGIDVEIYDSNVEQRDFHLFLNEKRPKIAGFSVLSGPCISDAIKKSRIAREVLKDSFIVWGGIHTTIFPDCVLKQPYIDYIVINEGEYSTWELCKRLLNNNYEVSDILNLGYKENGKLVKNMVRPFVNMDTLPLPAWDLVPMEKYIHNKFYSDRTTTLHTSRGCPWSCTYCYNELVNFRRWRGLSPEKILEQILYLKEEYRIKGFQFYDDEFDANPKRVIAFCNLLLKEKISIKWAHYSRTNLADEERFDLEKKAGCCFVEFGVESGSPRILEKIRKDQSVENIKNAFDICHKVGLKAGAMFMVGLVTETKDDVNMTVNLVKSLKAHQTINTIYRPYPGSELFDLCKSKGLFNLPDELDAQGEAFNISTTTVNVSNVETEYLQSIHAMFDLNNIVNEIKGCISNRNWKLLIYYIKKVDFNILKCIKDGILGFLKINYKKN